MALSILLGQPNMLVSAHVRSLVALALGATIFAYAGEFDDRETALWVLRKGGRVLVDGVAEYTGDPFELPDRAIRIVGVDMHGTVVNGKEFEPLGKLTELREILIPARVWSPTFDTKGPYGDEMFDYFANSKSW